MYDFVGVNVGVLVVMMLINYVVVMLLIVGVIGFIV